MSKTPEEQGETSPEVTVVQPDEAKPLKPEMEKPSKKVVAKSSEGSGAELVGATQESQETERDENLSGKDKAVVERLIGRQLNEKELENLEIHREGLAIEIKVKEGNRPLFETLALFDVFNPDIESPEVLKGSGSMEAIQNHKDRIISRTIRKGEYTFIVYDLGHKAVQKAEGGDRTLEYLRIAELMRHENFHASSKLLKRKTEKAKMSPLDVALDKASEETLASLQNRRSPFRSAYKLNRKHPNSGNYDYQTRLDSSQQEEYDRAAEKGVDSLDNLLASLDKGGPDANGYYSANAVKKATEILTKDNTMISLEDWPEKIEEAVNNFSDKNDVQSAIDKRKEKKAEMRGQINFLINETEKIIEFFETYEAAANKKGLYFDRRNAVERYERLREIYRHEKMYPSKGEQWISEQLKNLQARHSLRLQMGPLVMKVHKIINFLNANVGIKTNMKNKDGIELAGLKYYNDLKWLYIEKMEYPEKVDHEWIQRQSDALERNLVIYEKRKKKADTVEKEEVEKEASRPGFWGRLFGRKS